ncbi:hypothetical protein H8Z70_23380 (plasmid) [Xanthomonas citri pv. citri]|uniref:hypothetical protein n=1 Tax=Xanthomonas citri TaxID=346 RepID=UPI0019340368|nr:hypothetical protein [Xanthomonas citri]QRD76380.1 hypothetical protein H8Z71_23250 [Xanthomonas citri pv. citri]QRD80791.1 hypothetical protein H8Z70_23380 [Xanthomonas citri pv. citri]
MSYTLQPVPADVLAVLRAVADDVLRASRRLSARLKRALARVLALPIALLALATGAQAAERGSGSNGTGKSVKPSPVPVCTFHAGVAL